MRDLDSLTERYGLEKVHPIPALHAATVSVAPEEIHELLTGAATDDRIRYVSPLDAARRISSTVNDPLVQTVDPMTDKAFEWQFAASRVDHALNHSKGDTDVVVGVIDTGADEVPDLAGKIDSLWSVTPTGVVTSQPVSDGNDDMGHGTAVASLVAANVDDGFGMAGFGGSAHVIVVHAGEHGIFDDVALAAAIMKLDALGARIVNISAGGRAPSEPILVDAIHKAAADGVLLVASAGNDSHGAVSWPAAGLQPSNGGRSYGLAVGASDASSKLAGFSNSGEHLSLVAPGIYGPSCSGVLVALPRASAFQDGYCYPLWNGPGGAHYGYLAGTSFSAPQVAGVAALVWAARPGLRNYEVADIIKQSARRAPGARWTPAMGCGVLDAGAALELAVSLPAGRPTATSSDSACSTGGSDAPRLGSEMYQTISFPPLPDRTLGERDFTVSASASSGLIVSFLAEGACTLHEATVHITGTGTCSVTAAQEGYGAYMPAVPVTRTFSIGRAAPAVLALPGSGRWGSQVKLAYRVSQRSGNFAGRLVVLRNRSVVARLGGTVSTFEAGNTYVSAWRAPSARSRGELVFCVTVASAHSCARIRLAGDR